MKVGIYGQFYHANSGVYIQELLDILEKEQIEVVIEKNFLDLINENETITKKYKHFSTFEELDNTYDMFFSIGGDGTLLKTISYIRDLDIPIAGVNTGRLGFLATIQKEEIRGSINAILSKKYKISERTVLSIETSVESPELAELNFALNEIAVSRKNTTTMISVDTRLDNEYLTSYWADGLIISTPTGSTGYSLSCGGPIITPETKALTVTPIAPHNLNARPIVIPDHITVTLKVSGREKNFFVSMDSRIATLSTDVTVTIKKAPFTIKLVEMNGNGFISALRKKLLWGEDKRN
ncbi:MAG TPA: NAD kinase [Salinimicrobium sp.]|nr:NAD kinase [Salinimicrobium sp.]